MASLAEILENAFDKTAREVIRMVLRRSIAVTWVQPAQVANLGFQAVRSGDHEMIVLLIANKACFEQSGAAARESARLGDEPMVKLLAEACCPLEDPDEYGERPIHIAANDGHSHVVRTLHSLKCSITAYNKVGYGPLHLAADQGRVEVIFALHDLGVDVANDLTKWGGAALHRATKACQSEAVRTLLQLRSNINIRNKRGISPIHLAAEEGRLDVLRTLVNARADVNCSSAHGQTPAHSLVQACKDDTTHSSMESLKLLVYLRADLRVRDQNGKSPADLSSSDAISKLIAELL